MPSKTRYQNSIDTYLLLTKPCKMKHQFLTWQQFISYLKMPVVYGSRAAPRCRTSILVQEVTINILASSPDGLWLNQKAKVCQEVEREPVTTSIIGFTVVLLDDRKVKQEIASTLFHRTRWNFYEIFSTCSTNCGNLFSQCSFLPRRTFTIHLRRTFNFKSWLFHEKLAIFLFLRC